MERNEQWKLQGDCSLCRRKNYCKSECAASKAYVKRACYSAVEGYVLNKLFGEVSDESRAKLAETLGQNAEGDY